jgi:hypothetical protein
MIIYIIRFDLAQAYNRNYTNYLISNSEINSSMPQQQQNY